MARRCVRRHGHPLATKHGLILVSRLTLYEALGYGPHLCHWCRGPIHWGRDIYRANGITADHLDHDPSNDALDNLVASCQRCNVSRSKVRVEDDEPFVTYQGRRHRAELRSCQRCGTAFPALLADKRPNHGRFCSRSCARSKH